MNYHQIDVLDKGTVWQGGAVDAAIDSQPLRRTAPGGLLLLLTWVIDLSEGAERQ
jgi:hypothetical protein